MISPIATSILAMQDALRDLETYTPIPQTAGTRELLRRALCALEYAVEEQRPQPIPYPLDLKKAKADADKLKAYQKPELAVDNGVVA